MFGSAMIQSGKLDLAHVEYDGSLESRRSTQDDNSLSGWYHNLAIINSKLGMEAVDIFNVSSVAHLSCLSASIQAESYHGL